MSFLPESRAFSGALSRRVLANHSDCRSQLRWAGDTRTRRFALSPKSHYLPVPDTGAAVRRLPEWRHSTTRSGSRSASIVASGGLTLAKGDRRLAHRLARDPVGGRPFADRFRRDADDLFRGPHLRQAGRRGAPLRPRQGRERDGAGGDRAAVRAVRRGDLGGGASGCSAATATRSRRRSRPSR